MNNLRELAWFDLNLCEKLSIVWRPYKTILLFYFSNFRGIYVINFDVVHLSIMSKKVYDCILCNFSVMLIYYSA